MVVKGNFSSLHILNKKIEVVVGWHENSPVGHVVSCKKMRDEGWHTFLDMVGYCMKDNEGVFRSWSSQHACFICVRVSKFT